ncbi:MAG: single-stranded DNA-binding protein [Thermodesulfobacteriota bacterium]
MTASNRVILTGKVVTPSRRHYRPDGSPVIQFLLELNDSEESIPHHDGSGRGGRNRINIVAIGKLAEFDLDLLQSGQHLMVIGKLNQRNWRTPEGKSRSRTEVIATDLRTIEEKNQERKLKKQGE